MSPKLKDAFSWCKRYLSLWTLLCFGIVTTVVCYGDHSVFQSIDQDQVLDSLRLELQAVNDSTEYYRVLNSRLTTDPELVEQVVREQYGMKRTNEDVYTFE